MGMFGDEKPPPLWVPSDLSKPAGAAVDDGSNVHCVICGQKLALEHADVVGQGYRCASCTNKAEIAALTHGASDGRAHWNEAERGELHRQGSRLIAIGLFCIIGGLAILPFVGRAGLYLFLGGIGSCISGANRRRIAG